jgi:hypothetical protein
MRCFNCHEPAPAAPAALAAPHFCVKCGHPMAQPSPYLDGGEETYVPLTDDQNRPLTACLHSGGLFKTCRCCGRLYMLNADECETPRCSGPLAEPSAAFPISVGAFDGTHSAFWQGHFGDKLPPQMPQDTGKLSEIAFRYGILVGVTPDAVLLFQSRDGAWRRGMRVRLENPGPVRSLLLDDGYASICMDKTTYRVPLSRIDDPYVEESITESCLLQTSGQGRWVRLVERPGERSVLIVRDRKNPEEQEIELPFAASKVHAMVDGARLLLATEHDGLILVDLTTGRQEALPTPQRRWIRIAFVGDKIIALGYDDAARLTIIVTNMSGEAQGQYDLSENYLADFAWWEDHVYLATASTIATFQIGQISRQPEIIQLRSGEETQANLLALHDDENHVRLVVRRKEGNIHKLYLIDPATGNTTEIGGRYAANPLLSLAGSSFVVGAFEGGGVKLRNFTFSEGA